MLIVRPPGGKLTWLQALTSRRHEAITTILAFFTGFLIADGYGAYQKLGSLAGLQQCCQLSLGSGAGLASTKQSLPGGTPR